MTTQIAITDIDALVTELCEDLPNALRQIAAAIEAGRLTGRYRDHIAHGLSARGFGMRLTIDLHGDIVIAERAPEMLHEPDASKLAKGGFTALAELSKFWKARNSQNLCALCSTELSPVKSQNRRVFAAAAMFEVHDSCVTAFGDQAEVPWNELDSAWSDK